eukprot:496461_1
MEFLHNFLTRQCVFDGRDFSFARFKNDWKHYRMSYIFNIKHKSEPLRHFMEECNEYLTNCIYYNVINGKLSDRDFQLSTYCIYALYVLLTQQPCFEDNSPANYIYLPEYTWNALKSLIHYSESHKISDLSTILKHLMKNNYLIYCLERPITYSTVKADPYSKDGKLYCHGTRSRDTLIPTDLVEVMDLAMLASHKNRYQNALKQCGCEFTDKNEDFIKQLRNIRSTYQQQLTKIQKARRKSRKQFDTMTFPLAFARPAVLPNETVAEYLRCCDGYQAAINVFTLDKASKVANDIGDDLNDMPPPLDHLDGFIPPIPDLYTNENTNSGLAMPSLNHMKLPPFGMSMNNDDLLQQLDFTKALPPPSQIDDIINNAKNHNRNHTKSKDVQFAQIFGHDDGEHEVWNDTSSDEDHGTATTSNTNSKTPKKRKKKRNKSDKMEIDASEEDEEKAMTTEELERLEHKRQMLQVSQQNNRDTLDIIRGLEAMQESVTGKKLKTSTIEQLDINWKKHRKQTHTDRKRSSRNKKGRGRNRNRRKGKGKKVPKDDISSDDDEDIDFDDDGAFSHLDVSNKTIEEMERELALPANMGQDNMDNGMEALDIGGRGVGDQSVENEDVDVAMSGVKNSNANDDDDDVELNENEKEIAPTDATQALLQELSAFSQTL